VAYGSDRREAQDYPIAVSIPFRWTTVMQENNPGFL
jgi:hypothetical protein